MFTLIVGSVLTAFVLYVVVRLIYVIFVNVRNGMLFRTMLAEKVNSLRLSRMLAALGIDVGKYLHEEQVLDIEHQIDRCTSCENTETCDDQLQQGTVETSNIGYCNNESDLKSMLASKPDIKN